MVDQTEVKNGDLDGEILPKGLSSSIEFRQDLNMAGAYWTYNTFQGDQLKRILVVQKAKTKDDAKPEDIRKAYRGLGVTMCQQLQGKKANDVEIFVSGKVACEENLGIFSNSLYLCNYENSLKRAPTEEERSEQLKEKEKDEDFDERGMKHSKKIDSFKINTEHKDAIDSDSFKFQ